MRYLSILLVLASLLYSSDTPDISITTSVSKSTLNIGDIITYTVDIVYDKSTEITPPEHSVNLGSFEVRDYTIHDVLALKNGKIKKSVSFKITAYETGSFTIPPVAVNFKHNGKKGVMYAEPVEIIIDKLTDEEEEDIPDIKPELTIPLMNKTLALLLVILIFVLLLIVATVLYLRRKKTITLLEEKVAEDVEAFSRLDKIENSSLVANQDYVSYYFELSECLRKYISRRYSVGLLEKTTDESADIMRKNSIPNAEAVVSFLEYADFVKFAKHIPKDEECKNHLLFCREYVMLTKSQSEEDKKD